MNKNKCKGAIKTTLLSAQNSKKELRNKRDRVPCARRHDRLNQVQQKRIRHDVQECISTDASQYDVRRAA